jgi:hypothetical protein
MGLAAAVLLVCALAMVVADDQCNAYGPRKDCGASQRPSPAVHVAHKASLAAALRPAACYALIVSL